MEERERVFIFFKIVVKDKVFEVKFVFLLLFFLLVVFLWNRKKKCFFKDGVKNKVFVVKIVF